jgi:hypothetical protein
MSDLIGLHRYSQLKNQDFAASRVVPGKFFTSLPHGNPSPAGEEGVLGN